jgi:hypothetical protein
MGHKMAGNAGSWMVVRQAGELKQAAEHTSSFLFRVNQIMKSDAEICREKGWNVGDVLEGDEGDGPTRILITAIGERHILAKELSHSGADRQRQESHWTVQARKWKKV